MSFILTTNIPELNTPDHIYNEWNLLSTKEKPIPLNPNHKLTFENNFEDAKYTINSEFSLISKLIKSGKSDLYPSLMEFADQIFDFVFPLCSIDSVKTVKDLINKPNQENAKSIISNIKTTSASIIYKLQVLKNHTEFLANPKMPNPKYWNILYDIVQNLYTKLMDLISNSQLFSSQYISIQKILSSNPELTTSSSIFTIQCTPVASAEKFDNQSTQMILTDSTPQNSKIFSFNDSQPDLIDCNESQPNIQQTNPSINMQQQSIYNQLQPNRNITLQQSNSYYNAQQQNPFNNQQQQNSFNNQQQQNSFNNQQQQNSFNNQQQQNPFNYQQQNSYINFQQQNSFNNLQQQNSLNNTQQQNPFNYQQQQTNNSNNSAIDSPYTSNDTSIRVNTNPFNTTGPKPYEDSILKFSGYIHKLAKIKNPSNEVFIRIQSVLCELGAFNKTFNEMYSKVHSINPETFSKLAHCSIRDLEEMKAKKDETEKSLINAAQTENPSKYNKSAELYCVVCDQLIDVFKFCL